MRTYKTVQGDMWDGIAYKELGSTDHTGLLMQANRQYHDIYIFPAGLVLVLPEVQPASSEELPPWKVTA